MKRRNILRVEFWGTRGSVPSSYSGTTKFGGNTTCVEIRTRSNDHIILDAGSGIRRLGVKMMRQFREAGEIIQLERLVEFMVEDLMEQVTVDKPQSLRALEGSIDYKDELHLFFSHYHWDHIQGFPFFVPAYVPGKKINIYGQLKADHRLKDVLEGQMSKTYFPVYLEQMLSTRTYTELVDDTIKIGDATLTCKPLMHPQGCLGYRITSGEMTVVFATDTEHPENGLDENLIELADGADILIYDSQYTPEEYAAKKNWGHSTWEMGIKIAREAGAKKLVLCHHDPEHNDTFIENMEAKAREQFPNLMAAYEGLVLIDFPVEPTLDQSPPLPTAEQLAVVPETTAFENTLTVKCPPAMRVIGNKEFIDKLKKSIPADISKIAFDCSSVQFAHRQDMTALADAVLAFNGRCDVEIKNTEPQLLDRIINSRFAIVAKIPKKKLSV